MGSSKEHVVNGYSRETWSSKSPPRKWQLIREMKGKQELAEKPGEEGRSGQREQHLQGP